MGKGFTLGDLSGSLRGMVCVAGGPVQSALRKPGQHRPTLGLPLCRPRGRGGVLRQLGCGGGEGGHRGAGTMTVYFFTNFPLKKEKKDKKDICNRGAQVDR